MNHIKICYNLIRCTFTIYRLYSPSLSHQSLAQSLELESPGNLISSSFLDARFEMEHAVKTANRRVRFEMVNITEFEVMKLEIGL